MARIIQHTDDAEMANAAEQLKAGGLVAFSTETVYGLGAHAMDEKAAMKVFEVKGRPASDPLIVHVLEWEQAEQLVVGNERQMEIAKVLADKLWPGPLTMVLPAASSVPSAVTGSSGWVGVRSPKHLVARKLLAISNIPIAAPSANRFNHVSPTLPEHVITDLGERDPTLIVVDGGPSDVGIESTVVKIHDDTLEVLRRGAVTMRQLQDSASSLSFKVAITERDTRKKPKTVTEQMEGPGQMLTHYAPNLPAYLHEGEGEDRDVTVVEGRRYPVADVVVVDFASKRLPLKEKAHAYMDLSSKGCSSEAAATLFAGLRWTETFPSAKIVILPNLQAQAASDEVLAAVQDRLFRAASGNKATFE